MSPLARFLGTNAVGRKLVIWIHPRIHPRMRALAFASGADCWLCQYMTRELAKIMDRTPFEDRSSIVVSEPTEARRGISMTATARRQLDEIIANDPEAGIKIQETMDEIAKKDPDVDL
jgi:hypothetical protein